MNFIEQVVLNRFNKYFPSYRYPFLKTEEDVKSLSDESRMKYQNGIKQFVDSGALDVEIRGMTRHFMGEISFKAQTKEEFIANRVTLVFIQLFEQRLRALSQQFTETKKTINSIINQI